MTVEELIEELKRQPNQRVPVWFKGRARVDVEDLSDAGDSMVYVHEEVSDVRFDGGSVVLEGED